MFSLLFLIATALLAVIPVLGWLLMLPFSLAGIIMWAFLMFKAFVGETFKLPGIGDWAETKAKLS